MRRTLNPLRLDPTRTATLRRRFAADLKRRFKRLKLALFNLIVTEDAFGLIKSQGFSFNAARRWQFLSDDRKVEEFNRWLNEQIEKELLEVSAEFRKVPWLAHYVVSAYKKGIMDAFLKVNPTSVDLPPFIDATENFLSSSFNQSTDLARLRLLYTRSFEGLKGITETMATQIRRELADGLVHGKAPIEIARRITKSVDGFERNRARVLAESEINYSYNEGQLDAFEKLGVEEIGVEVEIITAGDDRVCPQCQPLENVVLSVDEARGLVPRHPRCRCAFTPSVERVRGQKRGRSAQRAIDKSIQREFPKRSLRQARLRSRWVGADLEI